MKARPLHTLALVTILGVLSTTFVGTASLAGGKLPGGADNSNNLAGGSVDVMRSVASIRGSAPHGSRGNPMVMPPNSNVVGRSYAEWSVAWWQWTLSHPYIQGPGDATGQYFPLYQSGSVWFLQGSLGPTDRNCTMPVGTFLVCPLFLAENDFPCPDPDFHPAPGQSMEDFLTEGLSWIGGLTPPSMTLDGVSLTNPSDYRATSKLFTFTGDLSFQGTFDPCVTGNPQVAVSDGYLVILKPLTPGMHTLEFSGFGDVTVHLNVVNGATQANLASPSGAVQPASDGGRVPGPRTNWSWGALKAIYR